MAPLRLAVSGAAGRMGRQVLALVTQADDLTLAGASVRPGSPQEGQPLGPDDLGPDGPGVTATGDPLRALENAQGVIDFSNPKTCLLHARLAAERGLFLVTGTTGFDDDGLQALKALGGHIPVVHAGNFSVGVAVLQAAVREAARALGPDFDIEIVETHHRHKRDAPSGTALMLGEAAAQGRGVTLAQAAVHGRNGPDALRGDGEIGFAALRGGSVIGEHTVVLAGPSERLEFTHRAEDRSLFAQGALRAARWAARQGPGFYSMADVLSDSAGG